MFRPLLAIIRLKLDKLVLSTTLCMHCTLRRVEISTLLVYILYVVDPWQQKNAHREHSATNHDNIVSTKETTSNTSLLPPGDNTEEQGHTRTRTQVSAMTHYPILRYSLTNTYTGAFHHHTHTQLSARRQ